LLRLRASAGALAGTGIAVIHRIYCQDTVKYCAGTSVFAGVGAKAGALAGAGRAVTHRNVRKPTNTVQMQMQVQVQV